MGLWVQKYQQIGSSERERQQKDMLPDFFKEGSIISVESNYSLKFPYQAGEMVLKLHGHGIETGRPRDALSLSWDAPGITVVMFEVSESGRVDARAPVQMKQHEIYDLYRSIGIGLVSLAHDPGALSQALANRSQMTRIFMPNPFFLVDTDFESGDVPRFYSQLPR